MVIINTKAVEVSIQAVSPELILSVPMSCGSVGAAGAAAAGRSRGRGIGCGAKPVGLRVLRRACLRPTPRESRASIAREQPIVVTV